MTDGEMKKQVLVCESYSGMHRVFELMLGGKKSSIRTRILKVRLADLIGQGREGDIRINPHA